MQPQSAKIQLGRLQHRGYVHLRAFARRYCMAQLVPVAFVVAASASRFVTVCVPPQWSKPQQL